MNAMQGLLQGFQIAFSLEGIMFVLIGVAAGTLIGMLPGLGPITAIAIMIPMIYGMDPTLAMVLMAGIYYGAVFGGSTASILLNAPGISGTVATAFDGYPMAQQGKAGQALAIAAISAFTGGTVRVVLLMLFAPALASVAVSFGPVEYFALIGCGLAAISSRTEASAIKAMNSGILGLMAVTRGIDAQTRTMRFTIVNAKLLKAIAFLAVPLGLFTIAVVAILVQNRFDDNLSKI